MFSKSKGFWKHCLNNHNTSVNTNTDALGFSSGVEEVVFLLGCDTASHPRRMHPSRMKMSNSLHYLCTYPAGLGYSCRA